MTSPPANARVKAHSVEPTSLLQDFVDHQHENVFMRAFSFPCSQLPVVASERADMAERVAVFDDIGFVIHLKERDNRVALKAADLEKWVTNQVARRGVKEIHATVDVMRRYASMSVVNDYGHRLTVSPRKIDEMVCAMVYRVPEKSRPFRAVRFKPSRDGPFIHILRDTDYFEICDHFVTPTELQEYFAFRRDVLLTWDPPSAAVTEGALIGQFLLEDYSSPPDAKYERAALSHGGPIASEFAFILDSLGSDIASQEDDFADTDGYQILIELARVGRRELRALKQELRTTLEAVRQNRFELPYRIISPRRHCGFLLVPVTKEFRARAFDALMSLSMASKHELRLEKQVGIGMWRTREFVDIEWVYIESPQTENPALDRRLDQLYPFRRASEKRLPPIFL
jgi:hypothetical protein